MTAEPATIAASTIGRSEAGPSWLSSAALQSQGREAVCRHKVHNWSARWSVITISAYSGDVGPHGSTPPSFDTSDAAGPSSATLTWLTPTMFEDGLPLSDTAAYRVYFGSSRLHLRRPETDIARPSAINLTVGGLLPGTWYFAVTAIDTSKRESGFSGIVSRAIP